MFHSIQSGENSQRLVKLNRFSLFVCMTTECFQPDWAGKFASTWRRIPRQQLLHRIDPRHRRGKLRMHRQGT